MVKSYLSLQHRPNDCSESSLRGPYNGSQREKTKGTNRVRLVITFIDFFVNTRYAYILNGTENLLHPFSLWNDYFTII